MSYIVNVQGRGDISLFLVDRNKTRNRWWSSSLDQAIQFEYKEAAQHQANKYHFKSPEVVSWRLAKSLERENERNIDYDSMEHPFSSEALGQD